MERRQSEAGRGRPGRGQGRAWRGRQCEEHLAVVATRVEAMREREKHEKERVGQVLYPLMFVGPTHQPTNISRLAYATVVVPYVHRPPD
jgi:hypothetical protein